MTTAKSGLQLHVTRACVSGCGCNSVVVVVAVVDLVVTTREAREHHASQSDLLFPEAIPGACGSGK